MVMKKKRLVPLLDSTFFAASHNRQQEWRQCCAVAMGFEWVDHFDGDQEEDNNPSPTQINGEARIQQVINLMDDDDDDKQEEKKAEEESLSSDPWTNNALRMQTGLTKMSQWIAIKKHDYVGLGMEDEEASLIQSTVTTFAATTAAELETLRKLIPSNDSGHRHGIVQILLTQLQEQITQPFSVLQKQRTRQAVQLWQSPWQCQLAQRTTTTLRTADPLFHDATSAGESSDKRFMARATLMIPQEDFLEKYQRDPLQEPVVRPAFLDRIRERIKLERQQQDLGNAVNTPPQRLVVPIVPKVVQPAPILPYQETQDFEQSLQQEAALLQETIVQSDLDSVQKMEQRMVEITTLIGQFSNLVSEQQEEILDIAQHAQETKQNMTKGQENLVDATERTRQSKHYLAWTIFGLTLTLLFFHTLRN